MKRKSDAKNLPSVEWRVRYCRKLLACGKWHYRLSGKLSEKWGVSPAMVRIHAAEARRQLRASDEARDDAKLFEELLQEAIEMARDAGGTKGASLLLDASEKVAKRGGIYKAEKVDVRHKGLRPTSLADIAAKRKEKAA